MIEELKVVSIGDDAEFRKLISDVRAETSHPRMGTYSKLVAYIDSRPRQGDQVDTVSRLDYNLLKLVLEQTQERLRQADTFIAQQEAAALAAQPKDKP